MRTAILLASFLFCLFFQAHSQGLIVTYEETRVVQMPDLSQIPDPRMRAAIQSQLRDINAPRSFQLFVNDGISVFRDKEPDIQTRTRGSAGGGTPININTTVTRTGIHTVYKNHTDRLLIGRATLSARNEYLIEESQTTIEWRISTERREVSGFQSIKATATMPNGLPVIAWFTPDIPINDGPYRFWGLPGLILYVDVNNGQRIFSATSVQHTNDLAEIHIPDGERISIAEFDEMSAQMRRRLDDDGERAGENVIIRTTTM